MNSIDGSGSELYRRAAECLDSKQALTFLRKAAELNHIPSMVKLGKRLFKGIGVESSESNDKEAYDLYLRVFQKGDCGAHNQLAFCYYSGRGVEQNLSKAAELWNQVFKMKHKDKKERRKVGLALNNLGTCYVRGEGVDQNDAAAVKLFKQALEFGYDKAGISLAYQYYKGRGVFQNYSEAARLWSIGAEKKNRYALQNLSVCYHEGHGVEKNLRKACELLMLSADSEFHHSYYQLGVAYRYGEGVAEDLAKTKQFKRIARSFRDG